MSEIPERDDWRRSVKLFRSFLTEQTDPLGFYGLIADDTVTMMRRHVDLAGTLIADFGGGAGFYSDAFTKAGATSLVIDLDHDADNDVEDVKILAVVLWFFGDADPRSRT